MRIGIDAKWYFTGPVSTRVMLHNLLPMLFDLYQDHQWFLFLDEKDMGKILPFRHDHVHILYVRVPTNMLSNIFILPPLIRNLKLDAVVFQTFPGVSKKYKSIAFIHDVLFKRFPQYFTWKEKAYFIPLPFFTKKADRVVATTDFVRRELKNYHFIRSERHVDIVPLGVSNSFKPLSQHDEKHLQSIKAKYHLPDNFILYVGRLNARKNIESLIRALPMLVNKSIHLVIVGKEDWKTSDLKVSMEKAGIGNRICMTGAVEENEIAPLFAMANIFCFPSFAEGFGLPPLEAMASGVPVVVSNTTSLPEICGEAAIYADPRQPETIAAGINSLLNNQSLYTKIRSEGLKRAAGFTWDNTANCLMTSIQNSVIKIS